MNAMDYEKKYNEALNLAKSYYGKGCNEFLDSIFPELAESEDERIEKQKPVQLEEEKEYIRTLKSRIADFLRGKDKDEVDITYYQRICDWLDGRHVEQHPAEWSEEQPEVGLEKEIEVASKRLPEVSFAKLSRIAKRFYELGLRAGRVYAATTYNPPCYCGGPCTNPMHDCINCPRQLSGRINTTTGTTTAKPEGER